MLLSRRGTIFSDYFNVSKFKSNYIFHVDARVRYCCTARNESGMPILRDGYVHPESLVKRNILPTAAHTLRNRLIIWATWLQRTSVRTGTLSAIHLPPKETRVVVQFVNDKELLNSTAEEQAGIYSTDLQVLEKSGNDMNKIHSYCRKSWPSPHILVRQYRGM